MVRLRQLALLVLWPLLGGAANLGQLGYQQMLGNQVSLQATFRDAAGRPVRFGDLLGGRPTILDLGYFHCPNLCGIVRADLMDALSRAGLSNYTLIVVSIDPAETPADASKAKQQDASLAVVPNAHYLTGPADQIQRIEQDVGFRSQFDENLKQFFHPAGIVFLTPRGTVSSYLLGVGYQPGDIREGVARAREGIAAKALPVLLLCFHYDPTTGRYTFAITRVLQLAGLITVMTVGGTIALALRRDRRQ